MSGWDRNRNCQQCGKPFLATVDSQKFCTVRCRIAREREQARTDWEKERSCARCGKSFIAHTALQKFCSVVCRRKTALEEMRAVIASIPPKQIACKHCGKIFETRSRVIRYCSRECRYLATSGGNRKPGFMRGPRPCQMCKKLIENPTSTQKYCEECRLKVQERHQLRQAAIYRIHRETNGWLYGEVEDE